MTYFGNLLFNALQKSCKETWHSNVALFPLSPKDQNTKHGCFELVGHILNLARDTGKGSHLQVTIPRWC